MFQRLLHSEAVRWILIRLLCHMTEHPRDVTVFHQFSKLPHVASHGPGTLVTPLELWWQPVGIRVKIAKWFIGSVCPLQVHETPLFTGKECV